MRSSSLAVDGLTSHPKGCMFMFTRCKGKKEGVNLFFDNGLGIAVFRKGIPGKELDGVMLSQGKIPIGGVGGIEIFAEEDWLVSLEEKMVRDSWCSAWLLLELS